MSGVQWMRHWSAALMPSIPVVTFTGVHDFGKAPPGYRRVGSLAEN